MSVPGRAAVEGPRAPSAAAKPCRLAVHNELAIQAAVGAGYSADWLDRRKTSRMKAVVIKESHRHM